MKDRPNGSIEKLDATKLGGVETPQSPKKIHSQRRKILHYSTVRILLVHLLGGVSIWPSWISLFHIFHFFGGTPWKNPRREVITFLQSPGYCKWSHSAARLLWPGNLGPKMLGNSEKIFPSVIMAMARKRSPFSSMIFPSPFSTLHLFELSHCYVWLPEVSRNNTGNKMVIWGCHRTWPYKYGEGYCCNSRTNASQRLGLDTNHLALHFYHVNQGFQSLFTTVSLLTHRSMIQTYNHGCLPYPDIPKGLASSVPVPTIMLV